MNDICKDCGKPIYWVEDLALWYHDSLADSLACPSTDVEPAGVTA